MTVIEYIKELNIEIGKQMFRMHQGQERPSPLQFQIMEYLITHSNEDICQKDLEKHLKLSKATVSKGLSSMENKGIIKRVVNQTDARTRNIIFTEDALTHFDQMRLFANQLDEQLTKGINPDELKSFMNVLQKMVMNIKESEHD